MRIYSGKFSSMWGFLRCKTRGNEPSSVTCSFTPTTYLMRPYDLTAPPSLNKCNYVSSPPLPKLIWYCWCWCWCWLIFLENSFGNAVGNARCSERIPHSFASVQSPGLFAFLLKVTPKNQEIRLKCAKSKSTFTRYPRYFIESILPLSLIPRC